MRNFSDCANAHRTALLLTRIAFNQIMVGIIMLRLFRQTADKLSPREGFKAKLSQM
jgi:hypothetical protein